MTVPVSVVLSLSSSGIAACLHWDFHTKWYFEAVITKMVGDYAGKTTYCQIDHSTSRTWKKHQHHGGYWLLYM